VRLHRGGRFRVWLGRRFGGGPELGDRLFRRGLHALGAVVLLYYVLPARLGPVPTEAILLAALAAVLAIEAARHAGALELPALHPRETHRVASFAWFAFALVVAVLVFPVAVATAVVLGAAFVDPVIGELRNAPRWSGWRPYLPLALYGLIALAALRWVGDWAWPPAVAAAALAAGIAVAVEEWRQPYLDDDLTMPLVPGFVLLALLLAWPWLPGA
jgi:hypothetical protein